MRFRGLMVLRYLSMKRCVCVCVGECGGMRVRLYLDCWMWMKAMHVRQVVHCLCLVKNKF